MSKDIVGNFQLQVLLAIRIAEKEQSVPEISETIGLFKTVRPNEAQIYVALYRLEHNKFVKRLSSRAPQGRGRPQIPYRLTSRGKAIVEQVCGVITKMAAKIPKQ